MKGYRTVLMVDDEVIDFLTMAKEMRLAGHAHHLEPQSSVAEAIAWVTARHGTLDAPCLVLLDLNLPTESGFSYLRARQYDRRLQDVPVCVITGAEIGAPCELARTLGADAFEVKPVNSDGYLAMFTRLAPWLGLPRTALARSCAYTPPPPHHAQQAAVSRERDEPGFSWKNLASAASAGSAP